MTNLKLPLQSFLQALGVVLYTSGVSWLMLNGERLFGKMANFWGPLMMLLLFMVSALITSLLVFGRPIYLYFEGKKKEGIQLLFWTAGWLIVITVLVFLIRALMV